MNKIECCCCFTGRRYIDASHLEQLRHNTYEIIKKLSQEGITDFICGGALGFDTLASQLVLAVRNDIPKIRLILAIPCKNQTQGWKKTDIGEYDRILSLADEVIYVSDEYYEGCMQKRNRFMVDNSSYCIFYMPTPRGGTAYTVKYAIEKERTIQNALNQASA